MSVPYSTSAAEKGGWLALRPWRLPLGKRPVDKVKFILEQAVKASRRRIGIFLLFFNLGARWGVGVQRHSPASLLLGNRPGTHCTGGWMSPRAGLDVCGKSLPRPGFDPGTVQPVASRYTDCPIPVPIVMYVCYS
jgi:hypothetical protein